MKSTRIRLVAASILFSVLGCTGGSRGNTFTEPPPPPAPPVLTSLGVSFPTATIPVGQSASATAFGVDQFGVSIATGTVSWSTASTAVATVNANGLVTGVAIGQTQVIAAVAGKQAQATVTVIPIPVASVTVSPPTATLLPGATQQLAATTLDAGNNTLTGRVVTWATSDQTRATVSPTGLVTAVAVGSATISATSEGKSGSSLITVSSSQSSCNSATALQLAVGGIHALTSAEKASLCLGGGASASEYALIPFNSTNVAASTIPLQITGTNTSAIQPGSLASLQAVRPNLLWSTPNLSRSKKKSPGQSFEWSFRERERRDLGSVFASSRKTRRAASGNLVPSFLTGIAASPTVGSIVQINANISGNTCSDPKQLHGAVVVAVLTNTIVLSDTLSPAGGYTSAEMTAFGQSFDAIGYALDTTNFGAPTDIDGNGRVAILFTPGVNVIPAPPGAVVGGLFAGRDLFPVSSCVASNEGEMFYMPVPDPNSTINGKYAIKANVARPTLATLVHEFQHLINAGRRMYVNNASSFEEVWLNEGLSHVAEELLYYRMSGNTPQSNIDLSLLQSSQAQLDAVNNYQINNLGRVMTYMSAPETNSPFSQIDGLEMRGAIWQLLRYSADRNGGTEQSTWSALVNTTAAGQANFNAVFGDIITLSRDWAVAQFTDDAGLNVPASNTNPSWNFRSVLPALNGGNFPLLTRALLTAPVNITLNGGGAGYMRFSVAANVPATIGATSSGQPVPSAVDFILVRTQ
jgi:Bacterial Ig-like domain (group 2)